VDAGTLAEIRDQITRAERFIEDLLRYGRPRPLELRMIDLRALVDLAFSTAMTGLGEDRPRRLEVVLEEPLPLVEADQAQVMQLLVILFENALLAVRDQPNPVLRAGVRQEGQGIVLVIEDSGPGIPADILPRLFEPFVTGRKRGARGGTGLGLAIARGVVERHRGTIAAGRSELGGARFALNLPRVQPVLAVTAIDAQTG
jgi:signal transduction histidine kinase